MTGEVLVYLVTGLVGGAVNAMAGGAKLFVFPMLLAAGLPPIAANVTQGVAFWPATLPAAWVYRAEIRANARVLARQIALAMAGSLIGALVMVNSSDEAFLTIVPFLIGIAVLAIVLGPRTTDLMRRAFPGERLKAATGTLIFAIGLYGGFFGAGFGFMLLAVLAAAGGVGIGRVNGAKNLIAFFITTVAIPPMVLSGLVDWLVASCLLVGGVFGGFAGGMLMQRLPEKVVRYTVAGLGLVLSASFILS